MIGLYFTGNLDKLLAGIVFIALSFLINLMAISDLFLAYPHIG
jgi:hypothetical protein